MRVMRIKPASSAPTVVPAVASEAAPNAIGTLNEKHLHASLRERYLQLGDATEVRVDGYIVDILRGADIIEIQTKNFSNIARKMRDLVQRHRVRLVYPMARDLWVVKMPTAADAMKRRKSPKHLDVIDIFDELVAFPDLIGHENFQLDVVITSEERVERFDSPKRWRRRGWVTIDRRLLAIDSIVTLETRADYLALIPQGLPEQFLTSDIATALNRPRATAQKAAYCLSRAGCIERIGSKGNAAIYTHVAS